MCIIVVDIKEKDILEKYRALDAHGKEMVDFTLSKEWERSVENKNIITPVPDYLRVNAANKRTDIDVPEGTDTSDDDIMDDTNF